MEIFLADIEKLTLTNSNFRRVIYTAKHSQVVLMCLRPGEEIGSEVHKNVDQFFRIEQGEAKFVTGAGNAKQVGAGSAVLVPAGEVHNVINASSGDLKLYTIYSPPNHPDGTINKTIQEAREYEEQKG